jgi:hypothetical protein
VISLSKHTSHVRKTVSDADDHSPSKQHTQSVGERPSEGRRQSRKREGKTKREIESSELCPSDQKRETTDNHGASDHMEGLRPSLSTERATSWAIKRAGKYFEALI